MKRWIVCILAIILLLAVATPALAMTENLPPAPSYFDCIDIWIDENPKIIEEIRKDDPPLWKEYFWYDSFEDFLYWWDMDEAYYYESFIVYERSWEYYDDIYAIYEREYAKWVGDVRVALGVPRTGLAVMVNDEYIIFPDAQPELSNGRTMLPIRALLAALGASVDFASAGGVVTAQLNDVTFEFAVGDSAVTVTKNGESQVVQMDCNTYIKDDRTYVPVRFFSEAAGYDVLWSPDFQTAVILDREAITDKLNTDFTVINKLLASEVRDPSKTYRTAADISAVFTSFSTLDGDLTARVNLKVTIVSDAKAQNIALSWDLSSLMQLLEQRGVINGTELEALSQIANLNAEIIVNAEENVSYLKFPLLTDELGFGKDAWLQIAGNILGEEIGTAPIVKTLAGGDSIGDIIYNAEMNDYYYYWEEGYFYEPVFICRYMRARAQEMFELFGDKRFTRSGNTWTITMDRDSYELLVYGGIPDEEYYDYKELDVRLSITDNGGYVSASGSINARENTWRGNAAVKTTGTFSMTPTQLNASVTIHTDNSYKLDLTLTINVSETMQGAASKPPAGAVIIPTFG